MYAFRQAVDSDYDFLFALHRATMREYIEPIWGWHEDWQEEYFRKKFEPQKRQIIVVDGEDAGVLVVEERPNEIYLGLIELLPRFQGCGVGTSILNDLKNKAAQQKVRLSLHVLSTNIKARRLYERFGFRAIYEESSRILMTYVPEPARP
jgi:ribosomal protein S18 acetylase RimI-like enzyme